MSVTIRARASVRPALRSLTRAARPLTGALPPTLEQISATLGEALATTGGFHQITRRGDRLLLSLHPAEERVSLGFAEDQIEIKARTSGAGPGYHAYVVELLDLLANKHHVAWNVEDPTGYWADREREGLEEAMAGYLQRLVRDVSDSDDGLWTLNFPEHRAVLDAPWVVLTPTGPWDVPQVEAVLGAKRPRDLREYFPWWRERDGGYWHSVAQALRWMDVIWSEFDPPGQRDTRRICVESFERAHQLDPERSLPVDEMRWLHRSLEGRAGGTDFVGGYRRHRQRWTLATRWEVELPGDFTQPQPQESGAWTSVGPATELFVTPYGSLDSSLARSRKAARTMVKQLTEAAHTKGTFLKAVRARGTARGESVLWRSESGELLQQGAKAGSGTLALATFMGRGTQPPPTWAPIWDSLAAVEPEQGAVDESSGPGPASVPVN